GATSLRRRRRNRCVLIINHQGGHAGARRSWDATLAPRWPESGDLTTVTLIGMVIGLIPLFLSLIDYAAARRTVVELPFAKIDFSRADIKRGSVELPDNIGRPGPIISDSAPMEIVAALEAATENQIHAPGLETFGEKGRPEALAGFP